MYDDLIIIFYSSYNEQKKGIVFEIKEFPIKHHIQQIHFLKIKNRLKRELE